MRSRYGQWDKGASFGVPGLSVFMGGELLIPALGTRVDLDIHGSWCHSSLSALYWGELRPDSPTYARFPNLLYTAELLCIKQNKNKVLPPYVNSPCHKVADDGNSTSSFSISAILHSCMLGYSCFFIC